ncbi:hypothetical protein VTI28DRAFT_4238 [Corynascus sepedonium]
MQGAQPDATVIYFRLVQSNPSLFLSTGDRLLQTFSINSAPGESEPNFTRSDNRTSASRLAARADRYDLVTPLWTHVVLKPYGDRHPHALFRPAYSLPRALRERAVSTRYFDCSCCPGQLCLTISLGNTTLLRTGQTLPVFIIREFQTHKIRTISQII